MSEPTDQGTDFREPPGDFLTYPENRVIALMDDPDEVAGAIEDLVHAGIEREQIFVLCGPEGAERLDISGRHHGLRGYLYRFAERLGGERELIERNAAHMAAGGLSIDVPADEEQKAPIAHVLKSHGGHDVTHFGKGHWTPLGP